MGGLDSILQSAPRVDSLARYNEEVSKLRRAWDERTDRGEPRAFFRGHSNCEWELRPHALRPEFRSSGPDWCHHTFTEFKRRAAGLVQRAPTTDWSWLYLAQHHGLPTRLLDFTESSHVALFFALQPHMNDESNPQHDACVWMLNPGEVNEQLWRFSSVVTLRDHEAEWFLAPYCHARRAVPPAGDEGKSLMCVIPEYVTERLRGQRGAFIAFGEDAAALERLIVEDTKNYAKAPLAMPFVVGKDDIHSVARELDVAGVTEATVYPDLNGLCSELARRYGDGKL